MQTASILPELVSGRGTTRRVVEGQAGYSLSHNPANHRVRVAENVGCEIIVHRLLDPRRRDPARIENCQGKKNEGQRKGDALHSAIAINRFASSASWLIRAASAPMLSNFHSGRM